METVSDADAQKQLVSVETTPAPKRRRKKSFVWDYFTVEAVSSGCTRACCKQCKQSYAYSTGNKIAGTSHLKRHILMGICPKIRQEKQQQLALTSGSPAGVAGGSTDPPKRRYRSSSAVYSHPFDQENSTLNLAKMIIMHEYPLNMVEHPSFAAFVHVLQPKFKLPDVDTIENEVMGIHLREKQSLAVLFGGMPGRVSLTIGLWSTSQTLGYVSLSGQFIDADWKLHRRMLNFMMVSSPHSENALSDAIGYSLSDWNIKSKLFTITLDNNCSSHDIYSANLRDHLSNKNNLMLKGQLFVVRCFTHILNVVAQDVVASIHGIVYNIRESVKYVKATIDREDKFLEITQHLQIPNTKILSLDVQSQWNTTYLMLLGALDFRLAFTNLEACDPDYNEAPSTDDWKKVEIVCTYLKLLFDSANVIMGTVDPTANIYFQEAWKIQLELSNGTLSEDAVVSEIAKEMHEKFDKYWKDCSLILAIAVIMDPRFKLKLVEFSFTKIYGQEACSYIKVIDDAIHQLYTEYVAQRLPLTPTFTEQNQGEFSNFASEQNGSFTGEASNIVEEEPCNVVEPNNGEGNVAVFKEEVSNVKDERCDPVVEAETELEAEVEGCNVEEMDVVADETNNEEGVGEDMVIGEMKDENPNHNRNNSNSNSNNRIPVALSTGDGLLDFDIYISETAVTNQTKSELDQYLEESLVPRIQEFDILGWWKLNTIKYPTLCKMARDVLAIPMSMSTSFSAGSGNKMLDDFRSSLRPDTVEALFCTRDWLQYSSPMTTDATSTQLPSNAPAAGFKMEF